MITSRGIRASRLVVVGLLALACATVVPGNARSASASGSTGVVVKKTVTRTTLSAAGTETVADSRNIELQVSQTTNLRGRQELQVTWKGAHPTGGTSIDAYSGEAGVKEEYPFVLLECRGVENPTAGQEQLSPETCWTSTAAERLVQVAGTAWPAWRSDRYATAAERAQYALQPSPRPADCYVLTAAERWQPFRSASGKVYQGGDAACGGQAPEAGATVSGGMPSNTTYGVTRADGTGRAGFVVWTAQENASLGCSYDVACTLVAVPIEGVSCDPYGTQMPAASRPSASEAAEAAQYCTNDVDGYSPGEPHDDAVNSNLATAGALWWTASNWRNRLSVPLQFAATDQVCSVVGGSSQAVYGSVLAAELTASWVPKFCTDKSLFPFNHVQSADSAVRQQLASGSIEAALSSRAPDDGWDSPVAQAPVAFSGFAIAYNVDAVDGSPITNLKLNARLVAKLLTQSYPALQMVQSDYAALSGNPLNISLDPEFRALNPDVPARASTWSAASLQIPSSDTDLMWALTSWIKSDPEASAWLAGAPDPWGMVVNPAYQTGSGPDLPTSTWDLLDTWNATAWVTDPTQNPCYYVNPSPILGLVASPPGSMTTVVQDVQFATSTVTVGCDASGTWDTARLGLKKAGRQAPSTRFILGLVPLSATYRYGIHAAALQTQSTVSPSTAFADASGRTFAEGTTAGLEAATSLLVGDVASNTWVFDYDGLADPAHADAYPGALPLYLQVPTEGLGAKSADRLSRLLCYAATDGQKSGLGNGQLPDGYLPLTDANGLGDLASYAVRASQAVKAQAGEQVTLTGAPGTCTAYVPPTETAAATTTSSGRSSTKHSSTVSESAGASVSVPVVAPAAVAPPVVPEAGLVNATATYDPVSTPRSHSPLAGSGVLVALALALLLALGGAVLQWLTPLQAFAGHARGLTLKLVRR